MESQSGGGIRGWLSRLRHAPLWVWLTVLLTAGLLIFAYLQYKKSATTGTTTNAAGLGTVPTDGSGSPLWSTADTSGLLSGNMTDLQALLAYLQSTQTPNAPSTAVPTIGGPVLAPGPSGGRTGPTIQSPPILAPGGRPPVTPPTGTTGGATPPTTSSTAKYFTITQNYSSANRQTTTLSGIAGLYHTTVARLMQLNPQITNPNLVYKGEKIRVA